MAPLLLTTATTLLLTLGATAFPFAQSATADRLCSLTASVTPVEANSGATDIDIRLLNENSEEKNSWQGTMNIGDTVSLGGLGPDVSWTLRDFSMEGYEEDRTLSFDYAWVENWNLVTCAHGEGSQEGLRVSSSRDDSVVAELSLPFKCRFDEM